MAIASVISGGFQKVKLPSYLPGLGILVLFSGQIPKRFANYVIIGLLALTLIVYTPLLGGISVLRHQALLDSCVEKDAKIEVISEDKPIYLIRNYYSYYWISNFLYIYYIYIAFYNKNCFKTAEGNRIKFRNKFRSIY